MGLLNKAQTSTDKLISNGNSVQGVVTDVKKCWWIKIKTKPITTSFSDSVRYPHKVYYEYEVMGEKYSGSKTLSYIITPPNKNAYITVYYNPDTPSKSTVKYP